MVSSVSSSTQYIALASVVAPTPLAKTAAATPSTSVYSVPEVQAWAAGPKTSDVSFGVPSDPQNQKIDKIQLGFYDATMYGEGSGSTIFPTVQLLVDNLNDNGATHPNSSVWIDVKVDQATNILQDPAAGSSMEGKYKVLERDPYSAPYIVEVLNVPAGRYIVIAKVVDGSGNCPLIVYSLGSSTDAVEEGQGTHGVVIPDTPTNQAPDPVVTTGSSVVSAQGGYTVTVTHDLTTDPDGDTINGYQLGMIDASLVGAGKTYTTLQDLLDGINRGDSISWAAGSGWVSSTGSIAMTKPLGEGDYYAFVMARDDKGKVSLVTTNSVENVTISAPVNNGPDAVVTTGSSVAPATGGYTVTVTHDLTTDPDGDTIDGYQLGMIDASLVGAGKTYTTLQDLLDGINRGDSISWAAGSGWVSSTGSIAMTKPLGEGDYYAFVMARDDKGKVSLVTTNSVENVTISAPVNNGPDAVVTTGSSVAPATGGYTVTVTHDLTTDPDGDTINGYQLGMIDASLVGAGKTYTTLQDLLDAINRGDSISWAAGSGWITSTGSIAMTKPLSEGDYYAFVMARDDKGKTSLLATQSVQTVSIAASINHGPDPVLVTGARVARVINAYTVTATHTLTTDSDGDPINGYQLGMIDANLVGPEATKRYHTEQDLVDAINNGDNISWAAGSGWVSSTGLISLTQGLGEGDYYVFVMARDDKGKTSLLDYDDDGVDDDSIIKVHVSTDLPLEVLGPPAAPFEIGPKIFHAGQRNESFTMSYIPADVTGDVKVEIYRYGVMVRKIDCPAPVSGRITAQFDATNLAPGAYRYIVTVGKARKGGGKLFIAP